MKKFGYEFTPEQVQAGLDAMQGEFGSRDIENAFLAAGVPAKLKGGGVPAYRGADSILQRERKAGHIRHIGNGKWERVSA